MELLTVYLSAIDEAQFKVIVQSEMGEAEVDSKLPFFETSDRWRTTLIKALEVNEFRVSAFPQEAEQEWMAQQGWLSSDRQSFHPSMLAQIGKAIYTSLFPIGEVRNLLQRAIAQTEAKETQLHIQLKFNAEVTKRNRLPDYPWELAHDGQKFLAHHQIRFSRYIAHLATVPKLPSVEKLNVVLVSSGASDEDNGLPPLSKREQKAVLKGLEKAQEENHIQVEVLEPASLSQLREHLTDHQPHVFHFDGHGVFGKRCNKDACRTIHRDLSAKQCKRCGMDLPEPQGYLLFETDEDEADYVSAIELGELLQKTGFEDQASQRSGVTVAILSACKSGMALGGESVFNGVAQRLINHRLPAVVAMQYTVRVDGATQFAEQFYRSLGRKNSLATAISQGQEAMGAEGNQWYRPMLYLRWQDNEGGQLFAPTEVVIEKKSSVPFQAPPLPSYYIDRPEVSQALKARLLQPQLIDNSSTPTLMISAIHGLGAIGKSTTATALAHDPDIQTHFSDGILWATLGQQPDLLGLLQGWVQTLGDYNFRVESVEATSRHLQTLLREKAILLVVDDAWSTADTRPFVVGGTKCQVLITTRDSSIAEGLRANNYPLDVMSPDQSMQLIVQKLKQEFNCEFQEQDQEQAAALAKAVGYLPLALELAVAQVAEGTSWAVLLQDLQKEVARLKSFDRPGAKDEQNEAELKRVSLTASLNLSIQRLPSDERENFIWLGVLPEDVTINPKMTSTLWDLDDERDATESLKYLRSKALLLPNVPLDDGTLTYRLHDLLHDLARNLLEAPQIPRRSGALIGLGLKLSEAQAELLKRYLQRTKQQLWHTLPDDYYIHEHLIWHMEQAGWIEEIHQMLAETAETGQNGWYQARERLRQTAGYISDIRRAWTLTNQASIETPSLNTLVLQCRYALIIASLNSVSDIPSQLLVALVKAGLPYGWTPEQGLAYARRSERNLLILTDELPAHLKEEAFYLLLESTQTIENGYTRSYELIKVIDKLPESLVLKAFQVAQAIQHEDARSRVLIALADKLPEPLLSEALKAAKAIKDDGARSRTLSALADKLPEFCLSDALEAAQAIKDEHQRSYALVALANKLPEPLVPIAFQAAQDIKGDHPLSSVLIALADKLPEFLLSQALEAARTIGDEYVRAEVLVALASRMPEMRPEALQAAEAAIKSQYLPSNALRFQILLALANELPSTMLLDILRTTKATGGDDPEEFIALANRVPESMLIAFFKAIRPIKGEVYVKIVVEFADKLPEAFLLEVFQTAQAIGSGIYQRSAFIALVDKLPESLVPQAFESAQAFENEYARSNALIALADKLPESLVPQAFESAQSIKDDYPRSDALVALADKLPENFLSEALEIVQAMHYESNRSDVLVALVNQLPELLLPKALEIARDIEDERARSEVFVTLANKSPEILPETLKTIQAANYFDIDQHRILTKLINNLPDSFLPEILKIIRDEASQHFRSEVLVALAHKLPESLLSEALETARTIEFKCMPLVGNASARYKALAAIAEKFPKILPEALKVAQAIRDFLAQTSVLTTLAIEQPKLLPQVLITVQAIEDEFNRCRVLVVLANQFPEVLPEALKAAQTIEDYSKRYEALSKLVDNFPEVLPEILQAVKAIKEEEAQLNALLTLVAKLPESLFGEAIEIVQDIKYASPRSAFLASEVLVAIADKLPKSLLPEAVKAAQSNGYEFHRAIIFASLGDKIPEIPPEVLNVIQNYEILTIGESSYTRLLVISADKLPNIRPEILRTVRAIEDDAVRSRVLIALSDVIPEVLPEALDAARIIGNNISLFSIDYFLRSIDDRYSVFMALADRMPEVLPETLKVVRDRQAHTDASVRAKGLIALSDKMPEVLPEALDAAQAIEDATERAQVMTVLSEKMPEVLPEVLKAIRAIEYTAGRASAFAALADRLPKSWLPEAFQVAQAIPDESDRTKALTVLFPRLLECPPISDYHNWQTSMTWLSTLKRSHALQSLSSLVPVIDALGGEAAIAAIAQTINDVCSWWE